MEDEFSWMCRKLPFSQHSNTVAQTFWMFSQVIFRNLTLPLANLLTDFRHLSALFSLVPRNAEKAICHSPCGLFIVFLQLLQLWSQYLIVRPDDRTLTEERTGTTFPISVCSFAVSCCSLSPSLLLLCSLSTPLETHCHSTWDLPAPREIPYLLAWLIWALLVTSVIRPGSQPQDQVRYISHAYSLERNLGLSCFQNP